MLDVVPPLLLIDNETIRTGALVLLSNLSTIEEASIPLATSCLDNLHKLARTTENPEYLYRSIVCFSNLASFEGSRQIIKEKGIDNFLKSVHAKNRDPDIQKEVTQALAELGEYVKMTVDDAAEEADEKDEEDDKAVKEELKQQIKTLVDRLEHETNSAELEKITGELQQILLHKYVVFSSMHST